MGHDKVHFDLNKEHYKFEGSIKTMTLVFMALGLLGAIWAFFDNGGWNHHARFWSNFLLNSYYFNAMALTAVFFISAHTIGYGGWIASVKRIFESFSSFILVGFVCFLIIIAGLWFDWHSLYHHWTHPAPGDTIVGDKIAFLNKGMYTGLAFLFFAGWIFFSQWFRKHSLASDHMVDEIAYNQKSKYIAAGYIVFFGVGTSVFSWLALMSLDPHWYSTLFGWYNFASYMCGFLCMTILIILILKAKGQLTYVNDSHMHNIVLFLFGFSVFWTYLWFSQFMLQWYGNIPEDTMWFVKRFEVPMFKAFFWIAFIINFIFPFLFLMKRRAKRNPWIYGIAAVILLFGHYLDFYSMVMFEPNAVPHHHEEAKHDASHATSKSTTLKLYADNHATDSSHSANAAVEAAAPLVETTAHADVAPEVHNSDAKAHGDKHAVEAHHATLGLIEVLMFIGFIGLFLFVILSTLSKNRLVPLKSPFLDESLNYHT
jgi:hypothetical protein